MQTMTGQIVRGKGRKATAAVDLNELRDRIGDVLNQLGAQLIAEDGVTDAERAEWQSRTARLGQIAAGLTVIDLECLPADGAGYGSTVQLRNLDTGESDEYTLMVGSLVDISANQVSLASPIGQALLGRRAGERVTIATPYKQSRMFIMKVVTLMELLASYETSAASR